MARGFISGLAWGGLLAAIGLGVISQSLPQPKGPVPELPADEAAPAPAPAVEPAPEPATAPQPEATAPPAAPAPEATPEPAAQPEAAPDPAPPEPAADQAEPAPAADPAAPTPEAPAPGPEAPEEAAPEPEATPDPEPAADPEAAAPGPDTATEAEIDPPPETPAAEAEQTAETQAMQSRPPAVSPGGQPAPAPIPAPPAEPGPSAEPTPEPTGPAPAGEPAPEPSAPSADAGPAAAPPARQPPATPAPGPGEMATPATQLAEAALPAADPAPSATTPAPLPGAAPGETTPPPADLPPPPPLTPEEEALLVPTPPVQPNPAPALITPDAPEEETGSGTLAPDPGLEATREGVRTDRLPRIGDTPAAEPVEETRPMVVHARPFDRDTGKPAFAILLVDPGGPDVDRTALAALPFPVSFVIDPLAPDARTAAEIYRAAGQEVLMMATGIPQGATPADLEQTFQAHAAVLPEAVAVIDLPEGGFQENRPLATGVVPVVGAQGRGLVTFDRGLNAADQVARRADLPAATVFRRLDAEGETGPVIRRYLDRAAFKAAQEGRVVVLGTASPQTVAAILEWTVEGRAASVALAPLTATLVVD